MDVDPVAFAAKHPVGILSAADLQPHEDADPLLELVAVSQLQERFIWPLVLPGL